MQEERGDGVSVLIKGMEMPERCGQCFLRVGNCKQRIYMERRPKGCPLVEVKEQHGRLGDLDELKSKFRHSDGDNDVDSAWISAIRRAITQAETIIKAEGG